jgi:beta-1,4-mannooligosaccharide/beta-1,4-mannosyl-N-acetylglucosamine phosphorylase
LTTKLINGNCIPNIPWEDKPKNCIDVVWRSEKNPIITRQLVINSNSIYNSAVVSFNGSFVGVFRVVDKACDSFLHIGKSKDGITWEVSDKPIEFICDDPEIQKFDWKYDPRVCFVEDRYYITWCNEYHGPTVGIAYTFDFIKFYQLENAFVPYNRNGVLFPRKIKNKYILLSRPSDMGDTPYGDIFMSESPDLIYWGRHRHVMGKTAGWQGIKIGAGPSPIETSEGWLLIYHGVGRSCNGLRYSFGAALLDLDNPNKVLYRTKFSLLHPETIYECVGNVDNVVFPCASLVDSDTGRMAIYYGGADTVCCLAYSQLDELIDYTKKYSSI